MMMMMIKQCFLVLALSTINNLRDVYCTNTLTAFLPLRSIALKSNKPQEFTTRKNNKVAVLLTACKKDAKDYHNENNNNDDNSDETNFFPMDQTRRNALFASGMTPWLMGSSNAQYNNNNDNIFVAHAATTTTTKPVIDVPMQRLTLPPNGLGREYVLIQLKIDNQGPFDFMVDSGLTTELITPHLRQMLQLQNNNNNKQQQSLSGISASGARTISKSSIVELSNVSLVGGGNNDNDDNSERLISIPNSLTAIVTDFPQEHIDPKHDPVEGMIGMELLQQFDVDFDFPAQKLRFWKHGTADISDLVEIPAAILNESGLLGIRIVSSSSSKNGQQQQQQPIVGIIDCGSSFSAVNEKGAKLLNIEPSPSLPSIMAAGVNGKPIKMSTAKLPLGGALTFVGNAKKQEIKNSDGTSRTIITFDPPPENWTPWKDSILMGVGNLALFDDLLGNETGALTMYINRVFFSTINKIS